MRSSAFVSAFATFLLGWTDTNWYDETPNTGVTREYWFDIQNGTATVDGVERLVMTVNGQFPGPTIMADWGDWVVVHVTNSLQNNGTSIHWHGLRQEQTSSEDGVASITQCPIAPGDTYTYRWRAEQYGHSWYHSHFALQAWNGVVGGIQINGPAAAPYDEDKGLLMLNDWFHETTDQLWDLAKTGYPPPAQNGLINGTNVYGNGGKRFETTFTSGKRHRLRLVNAAIDTHFKFSIDNHKLTVIAADLVPIKPYTTEVLSIGIGQRYDVIVEANQGVGDFWLRAVPDTACSASNEMQDDIKGVIRYDLSSTVDPDTTPYSFTMDCLDEAMSDLVPYVALDVEAPATREVFDLGFTSSDGLWKWTINSQTFLSDWGEPTLLQAVQDASVFKLSENVVQLKEKDSFVYFVIQSQLALTHPIHLHGHDFWVLAQEANANFTDSSALQLSNPVRRDVAMLPAAGYVVIAFVTDNPGVWAMHCHIGWHASQGFALQLVEREAEIADTLNLDVLDNTCANWAAYTLLHNVVQEDSGI
ncbi:hypothetical protein JX265_000750 [Neoarthrinium moseri]|uniref:Laccase n=1 Tax=Neoarthrinium moseri TaxID=1658444 RepID=A0A9Q0AUI5_9PEZI|nr:uncharacterized protein JN550_007143 [Neoarthrinium moseri]KAI1867412.1 hypothetical protein JN550_007143 [Neoarthrinium moseri]KAI1880510.1 hypothetical protein JX265_000750 [Neoarthrinium moseri]